MPYSADASADAPADAPADADADVNAESSHILDLSYASRTYKTLISGGHYDAQTESVAVIDGSLAEMMSVAVWDTLRSEEVGGDENVRRVARGNAALVLVETIAGLKRSGRSKEVKAVLGGMGDELRGSGKRGAGPLADALEVL